MLVLLLFNTATANAIPVRVDTFFRINANPTSRSVATEAFFDNSSLTGVGREDIQIDAFTLVFSDIGFKAAFGLDGLTPPLFVASFRNGLFTGFGASGIIILPRTVSSQPESISFDSRQRLQFRRNFSEVAFGRVSFTPEPIVLAQISVSEPSVFALFGAGLFGTVAVARRRRRVK